jgi:hypothetical protein
VLEQQNSLKRGYKFFLWWTNETHVCSPASQDWEAKIPLLPSLLPHLQWWIDRENVMKGLSLSVLVPTLTLYTDASAVEKTVWLLRTESVGTTEFSEEGIQIFLLVDK